MKTRVITTLYEKANLEKHTHTSNIIQKRRLYYVFRNTHAQHTQAHTHTCKRLNLRVSKGVVNGKKGKESSS